MSNSSGNGSDGNDPREIDPILETSDDSLSNIPFWDVERLLLASVEVNRHLLDALKGNQNGLQEENLEKLVVTVYSETEAAISSAVGEKTMCLICYENYKDGDSIVRLHCKHIFCKSCLFTWLKIKKICPYCRDDVMLHLKQ